MVDASSVFVIRTERGGPGELPESLSFPAPDRVPAPDVRHAPSAVASDQRQLVHHIGVGSAIQHPVLGAAAGDQPTHASLQRVPDVERDQQPYACGQGTGVRELVSRTAVIGQSSGRGRRVSLHCRPRHCLRGRWTSLITAELS